MGGTSETPDRPLPNSIEDIDAESTQIQGQISAMVDRLTALDTHRKMLQEQAETALTGQRLADAAIGGGAPERLLLASTQDMHPRMVGIDRYLPHPGSDRWMWALRVALHPDEPPEALDALAAATWEWVNEYAHDAVLEAGLNQPLAQVILTSQNPRSGRILVDVTTKDAHLVHRIGNRYGVEVSGELVEVYQAAATRYTLER